MGESTVITERETEVIEKRPSPGDTSPGDIVFQEAAVVDDEAETAAMPVEADAHKAPVATVNGMAVGVENADAGDAALDNRDIDDDAVAADELSPKQSVKPTQAGLRPGLRAGLAR